MMLVSGMLNLLFSFEKVEQVLRFVSSSIGSSLISPTELAESSLLLSLKKKKIRNNSLKPYNLTAVNKDILLANGSILIIYFP